MKVSVLIRGDLSATRSRTLAWRAARRGVIRVGSGQKPAEVIVAGRHAKLAMYCEALQSRKVERSDRPSRTGLDDVPLSGGSGIGDRRCEPALSEDLLERDTGPGESEH